MVELIEFLTISIPAEKRLKISVDNNNILQYTKTIEKEVLNNDKAGSNEKASRVQ